MAEKTESPVSTLDIIVQGAESYFDSTITAAERFVTPEGVFEDVEAVGEFGGGVGATAAVAIAGFEFRRRRAVLAPPMPAPAAGGRAPACPAIRGRDRPIDGGPRPLPKRRAGLPQAACGLEPNQAATVARLFFARRYPANPR